MGALLLTGTARPPLQTASLLLPSSHSRTCIPAYQKHSYKTSTVSQRGTPRLHRFSLTKAIHLSTSSTSKCCCAAKKSIAPRRRIGRIAVLSQPRAPPQPQLTIRPHKPHNAPPICPHLRLDPPNSINLQNPLPTCLHPLRIPTALTTPVLHPPSNNKPLFHLPRPPIHAITPSSSNPAPLPTNNARACPLTLQAAPARTSRRSTHEPDTEKEDLQAQRRAAEGDKQAKESRG